MTNTRILLNQFQEVNFNCKNMTEISANPYEIPMIVGNL